MGKTNQLRRKKRDKGRATHQRYGKYRPSRNASVSQPSSAETAGATVVWVPRRAGKPKTRRKKARQRPAAVVDDR